MYGSEKTDLVVKCYDRAIGVSGEAEVAWYLAKARASGGPVLDLACGTGRLAPVKVQRGRPDGEWKPGAWVVDQAHRLDWGRAEHYLTYSQRLR